MLAISTDELEDSKRLREDLALPFRLLSALDLPVLADYGLVDAGGGLEGETIAVPAELLVAQDGTIVWKHVASRITERAAPAQVLAALARFTEPAGTSER